MIVAVPYNAAIRHGHAEACCPIAKPCPQHAHTHDHNLVAIPCPDCNGLGFTRRGPLHEGEGVCVFCDRCDGTRQIKVST